MQPALRYLFAPVAVGILRDCCLIANFCTWSSLVFTSLHALHATWSNHETAVCLSVKCVICDKMKDSCTHILIPHDRTFIIVLETERTVGRKQPILPEILG